MDLREGLEREIHCVVLCIAAAAEGLGLDIEDADDGKDVAFHIDVLADGGLVGEEVLGGVVAEDGDIGAALFLSIGPHAAFEEFEVLDFFELRGVAIEDGVGNLVGSGANGDAAEAGLKILIGQVQDRRQRTWGRLRMAMPSSRVSFLRLSSSVVGRRRKARTGSTRGRWCRRTLRRCRYWC
jgi:hypothetical protein